MKTVTAKEQEEAWIGDAVLALYVRDWVLKGHHRLQAGPTEIFKIFTSNQFLSAFGQPTLVEAELGRVYHREGLTSAFRHIEAKMTPLFLKQMRNRERGGKRRPAY